MRTKAQQCLDLFESHEYSYDSTLRAHAEVLSRLHVVHYRLFSDYTHFKILNESRLALEEALKKMVNTYDKFKPGENDPMVIDPSK